MTGNTPPFQILPVAPSGRSELLELFVGLFHDREPLTRIIGLSRERMISVANAMHSGSANDPLSQGLSWIVRDTANGDRAVAFVVCDDPLVTGGETLPDDLTESELKKVEVLGAFLNAIRLPLPERVAWRPGACLHIAALGVAPGYEGRGIATRLLETVLAEARRRGFQNAFAECTGPASRACHERCGFKCVHSVSADAFEHEGARPLQGNDLVVDLMVRTF